MSDPLHITATDEWQLAHPGAMIGLLEMAGFENRESSTVLNERKEHLKTELTQRYNGFSRKELLALPVMTAYDRYYTRFNKTYHVQLQLESIVLKGRDLPTVSPAVDANFMAELDSLVLTAGHDAAKLYAPVRLDVSRESDTMTLMNGTPKTLAAGDMVMRDAEGICCSIIYGQDNRSPISPETMHVLYVAYAPAGVPTKAVESQLRLIERYLHSVSPGANVLQSRVIHSPHHTETQTS